jgi:protein-S-isoprenylcysteine O-methyltransferase Ste14
MPEIALAFVALWFAVLFGVRTAIHWWRTGSTGYHLFPASAGPLARIAGGTGVLGLAAAAAAPFAALYGLPGSIAALDQAAFHAIGLATCAVGLAGCLWAQLAMGESWRIGVDEDERTELVTRGIYARVRNPIFTFMVVSAAGLLLLVPNAFSAAALVLTTVCVQLQVRAVEEPYLRRVHGDAYAAYAARAGRFVPGIGRLT